MTRTHLVSLMALIVAVPAAAASSYFASGGKFPNDRSLAGKPCFIAGTVGYRLSAGKSADYTVRIDNNAASPTLRLQIVDDPAAADFVLVDDGDAAHVCNTATAITSIRLDPAAANPDLTVAVSRAPADHKIYVRSATYSEQDATALFAAIWQDSAKKTARNGGGREFAERR